MVRNLNIGKFLFIVVLILSLFIPLLAEDFANKFNYSIDPNGAFAWITVHHLFLVIIYILAILLISKFTSIDFGFNKGDVKRGKKYVFMFVLYFSIYVLVTLLLRYINGGEIKFGYPESVSNIVGHLSFQLFISGPVEEIVYRAFPITLFFVLWRNGNKIYLTLFLIFITSLFFALAHIQISFNPFELRYDVFQLMYAFVLGWIFADCYVKTKSILYPILLHSLSNVISVVLLLIFTNLS